MARNGTVSARKAHFVECYVTRPTVKAAAEAAGISRRTAERYLSDGCVKVAIGALQGERLRQASANVAAAMGEAVKVLRDVMTDDTAPASTRANAAARLLEGGLRLTELVSLSERLDDLEARLPGGRR